MPYGTKIVAIKSGYQSYKTHATAEEANDFLFQFVQKFWDGGILGGMPFSPSGKVRKADAVNVFFEGMSDKYRYEIEDIPNSSWEPGPPLRR